MTVETTTKQAALATYLECETDDIYLFVHDDCMFGYGSQEWLVLDEDERELRWDESLESYLEDCVYPELPELLANYFDDEAWKRDARHDGCGHALASYDGNEEKSNCGTYWLYRIN